MIIGRESCSRPHSGGEQSSAPRPGKVNARAVVSCELVSASLRLDGSGQPARVGEASIGREASIIRTVRTLRGGRRQRARKEPSGTWETPLGVRAKSLGQLPTGSHNRRVGRSGVSDGLIVAGKFRSSRDGAKEPWFAMRTTSWFWPDTSVPSCETGSRANWKAGWGCRSTGRKPAS